MEKIKCNMIIKMDFIILSTSFNAILPFPGETLMINDDKLLQGVRE